MLARRRLPEGLAGIDRAARAGRRASGCRRPSRTRCWSGSRPTAARGCRRWSRPATRCIAINPLQVARYRERHSASGAKSDPGDAHVLAEIVRLDRAHHRPVAGDSELAEHVKVAARAHQTMIWTRQRQVQRAAVAAAGVLPGRAGRVRRRPGRPRRAGGAGRRARPRRRAAGCPRPRIATAAAQGRPATQPRRPSRSEIRTVLRAEQLAARPGVVGAYAASASALVAVIDRA